MSDQFEFQTTLNGGVVSVWLDVVREQDEDGWTTTTSFAGVFHDCTEVTSILSKEQLAELEMAAEHGFNESAWESSNGY